MTTQGQSVHPTPPASTGNMSPRPLGIRPTLPDKRVMSETIEDAYVKFIMYCNPAVPLETDTAALREAFRTPPKSDGKSFSTFTLFQLIKQLEDKEIKTWAELALKLGVKPPDQDKGQSSQKIQQYAVRLKRWMHSMHVNAFFDYMLDNPHPYWTEIPSDPNPICEDGRDGVAAEDDMALRALLPQIRPRRGRRKPEDDGLNKSPSQRPRLSPTFNGEVDPSRSNGLELWTAHPDTARTFLFPPPDQARSAVISSSESAFPWHTEVPQTSLTSYPQSAITPINGRAFWADPTEPRSAITPSKARLMGRRHGAKVVSSAWRSGSSGVTGKIRGRPPTKRAEESPMSAFPDSNRVSSFQTISMDGNVPKSAITPAPAPVFSPNTTSPMTPARPTRPGRLSLQVPERPTGSVRLATPPPVVMINGEKPTQGTSQMMDWNSMGNTVDFPIPAAFVNPIPDSHFQVVPPDKEPEQAIPNNKDATEEGINVLEIESLFVSEIVVANWCDAKGNNIPACGVEEAIALTKSIIRDIKEQAVNTEAFLINLSALAGGSMLMRNQKATITRLEEGRDCTKYSMRWELRYGSLKGSYVVTESVPHDSWKRKKGGGEPGGAGGGADPDAELWKKKYKDLLRIVEMSNHQTADLRVKVFETLKGSSDGRS
ncbi:ARS binding protein 2-domain-containing protein [Pseudomassariella vexata]|uniref:ARS binding protein 2-domain-containing protein n=1 Tax=Pseudomassariella vexata TaxID=1141098 RepID=A0A1Y2DZB0_9PEZI|nr:ARS binding protein 2-domain-containing protein [Pseudomassariella vexata]ORY63955.1 ARS binding protein 2-domain-containing protein [Pseudomassariella vexata]